MPPAADPDPIAELVAALERDGRATLAWAVGWSAGGAEPVAAAWAASRHANAMAELLVWAGFDVDVTTSSRSMGERARGNVRSLGWSWTPHVELHVRAPDGRVLGRDDTGDLPGALRRLVPAPPTLAALLAQAAVEVPFG